jgi:hypothetical protein
MRLWQRIKNKNTYLSVLIIVLGNMLLLSTITKFISKITHIFQPDWLLNFLGMFIITLILFLATIEVFEI